MSTPTVSAPIAGRYDLLSTTEGATGILHVCHDRTKNQVRALRTLQDRFLKSRIVRELFIDDVARWLGVGYHGCVATIDAIEIVGRRPFVVTNYIRPPEWIGGSSLRSWIGTEYLSIERVIDIALQISAALAHAERTLPGFEYGDLRPEKILIADSGVVTVAVPGGSKARALRALLRGGLGSGDADALQQFCASGTSQSGMLPYLPRETGTPTRTDIYSFGCILREMLAGSPPATFKGLRDWIDFHERDEYRAQSFDTGVPPGLRALATSCLESDPEKRPPTFAAVEAQLHQVYEDVVHRPHRILTAWRETERLLDFDATTRVAELAARGFSLEQLGRYDDAVAVLEHALTIVPDDRAALTRLANVLLMGGEVERSSAISEQVVQLYPTSSAAWLTLGTARVRLTRWSDALAAFDEACRLPDETDKDRAWLNRGTCLLMLQRIDEALESFENALDLNPVYVKAWAQKSAALTGLGRIAEALASANRAIDLDPTTWTAWMYKIQLLEQMGRSSEALACRNELIGSADAILAAESDARNAMDFGMALLFADNAVAVKAFDRALVLAPNHTEALLHKGVSLRRLRRFEESLACYEQLVAVSPQHDIGWLNRGNVLSELNRTAEAIDSFHRALAINPRNALAAQNLGNEHREMGMLPEAIEWYEKAVRYDPQRTVAWQMMARSLAALGRIDEAMQALTRGLEANPETSELWLFQAELHQHSRDTDAAIQSCNRAIDANPRDVDAWRFKSVLLIGSRRFTEAIACCDAGLRHHHAAGELLNNKGVALMRINEPASAIKCFETAVQVEPGLAIAWRNLGTQLLGTDRNEEGQQYLQRAQSLESRR